MKRVLACLVLAVAVAGCGPSEETREQCENLTVELIATGANVMELQELTKIAIAEIELDLAEELIAEAGLGLGRLESLGAEFDELGCEELLER